MAWDLVGELRQLADDLITVSPQENAIKAKHPGILEAAAREIVQLRSGRNDIAAILRDQVMMTWNPPIETGGESKADIAQTSTMLALAFVFGKDFLGKLTIEQRIAVDSGLKLFESVLVRDTVSQNQDME